MVVGFVHAGIIQPRHSQDNAQIDVGQSAFNRIAAFQNSHVGIELFIQKSVALGREIHIG